MPHPYCVTFYRELLGDNGRRHDSALDRVEIATAPSEAAAVAVAIRSFERQHHLVHWDLLATKLEVIRGAAPPPAPGGRGSGQPRKTKPKEAAVLGWRPREVAAVRPSGRG